MRLAAGASGGPALLAPGDPDRLQRGQGVIGALVVPDHAPQLVIAEGVAAMDVPDAPGTVAGRAAGQVSCVWPSRRRGRDGPAARRTGRTRSSGPGNCWSRTRSGPAWRRGPD